MPDDAQVVEDAVTSDTTEETTTETQVPQDPWFLSETLQGEGEKPDWFKSEKYKTISDQAKAYTDLEGKFGSFTGSPEKYEINLSDENREHGVEIDADDPLLEAGMKLAKESNMNQEGFDKFVNMIAMMKVAENKAMEELKQDQFKALGDRAMHRIDNLVAWGNKNLPSELQEDYANMAQNAGSVRIMEALIAKTRPGAINPTNPQPAAAMTAEKIKEMQFALDDYGNRKMSSDPAYRKEVEGLMRDFYGNEEHMEILS